MSSKEKTVSRTARGLYYKDNDAWRCSECNRLYSTRGNVNRHIKVHTLPEERWPFGCSVCSMRFLEKTAMIRHARKHIDECVDPDGSKPYICEFCPNEVRFRSYTSMQAHYDAKHLEQCGARFFCEDCHKGFLSNWRKTAHMEQVHGKQQVRNTQIVSKRKANQKETTAQRAAPPIKQSEASTTAELRFVRTLGGTQHSGPLAGRVGGANGAQVPMPGFDAPITGRRGRGEAVGKDDYRRGTKRHKHATSIPEEAEREALLVSETASEDRSSEIQVGNISVQTYR